ncbi:putative disease resistance RPP13-like protein 1 [Rutidosis leptorrhynchoides]|uniref:putative disease resistance RPP13-like protein 1 n=1 Tax=Rutidosis leptorrhynchoides TaxID=125765 RepID=UPI003A9902CB
MVGGEIFLSAFLQVLFERLTPRVGDLWKLARRDGLEKKLEALVKLFRTVEAVLADAEEKMFSQHAVKIWLDDLRELAYDAEDVLDEFSTESLRLKVKAKQQAASNLSTKCANLAPARFTPSALKFKIKIGSKIDAIMSRLEAISKRKDQLCLVGRDGGASGSSYTWQSIPTTSSPIEVAVYGRDDDKKNIVEMLLKDNGNCDVIPIVAMGGAGKTTLAQHVYGDHVVSQAFQTKAWVCVSNDFNIIRVMKALLEDLTSQPCELKELQSVKARLEGVLTGKRFLIVLDDIWEHTFSQEKWLPLKSLFIVGGPGSKIIVTTRQLEVAKMMGTIQPYKLKLLSDEDCWKLFKTHAFNKRDVGVHINLESIHEKVVSSCDGLPLAARILGGLLCSKAPEDWGEILNSQIWNMHGDVREVLRLSYHYLPRKLKKCFSYCAVFPQDYEFTEEELVLLWMAEGLIEEGNKKVIEAGCMCFRELVSRSLFQTSSEKNFKFIMHDLVHELAQKVDGGIHFLLDDVSKIDENQGGIKRARHLSYISCGSDISKRFEGIRKAKHLRTFLPLRSNDGFLANSVLHQIPQFKRLRTLSLSGYYITELPDSIGNLKYLRYLDLSSTYIRCLPESTCSLYNLLILSLRDCYNLKTLPSKMENLISLCYLDITNANSLEEMPPGLGELKSLQVLSNFIVGKGGRCSGVNELMNLKDLRGTLHISKLENVGDANNSILNEKEHLEVLELRWDRNIDDFRSAETEKCVFNMLQPHKNLKELIIGRYGGDAFPTWLGDPSFSNMKILKLENCKRCTYLPSVGQLPSLKVLEIRGMDGVKSVGAEFSGTTNSKVFLSLQSLSFHDMPEWENWNVFEVNKQVEWFSRLCEFSIVKCPKLLGNLPNHFTSLKKLEVRRCEKLNVLNVYFPESCMLEIDGCEEIASRSSMDLTQATHLQIHGNVPKSMIPSKWKSTGYLILYNCSRLQRFPITLYSMTHLISFEIKGCSSLVSPLPSAVFSLPVLETINIQGCTNLEALIDEECYNLGGMLPDSITYLKVSYCGKLECVTKTTLPSSLTNLDIYQCKGLEFVAETFMESTKLESIVIRQCDNLQRLPDDMHTLGNLEKISIEYCPNLLCFPQGGLPKSNKLKELSICWCDKLAAPSLIGITSLTSLSIGGDDNNCRRLLEWEGLHTLPNLTSLYIYRSDMEEIPVNNLPISLKEFVIVGCPNLTSLSNLPHSLTQLEVYNCPKLMSLSNLPHSLTRLKIYQICLTSLLNLPISLTQLEIWRCLNIVSLPNLPIRLIELKIYFCENLKYMSSSSFNNFHNLTSLETLRIWRCPKLKSLPKEGLPPSLECLDIIGCPLLKERCKRDKGKDWRKIADIPEVENFNCDNKRQDYFLLDHSILRTQALKLKVMAKQQKATISSFKREHIDPARFTSSALKFKKKMGQKMLEVCFYD